MSECTVLTKHCRAIGHQWGDPQLAIITVKVIATAFKIRKIPEKWYWKQCAYTTFGSFCTQVCTCLSKSRIAALRMQVAACSIRGSLSLQHSLVTSPLRATGSMFLLAPRPLWGLLLGYTTHTHTHTHMHHLNIHSPDIVNPSLAEKRQNCYKRY